ncbi:hypothetical protein VNO77_04537 [Canavalia gladiata]|uniref:Uncharacterized protein n=1 Tax=Canavalia gladiata TaxID=3824 RepID=A0AAN9MWN9_CANGL
MLFITVCSRWWESWYMDDLLGLGRLSCILASFNKVAQLYYPWHCFTTILVLGKSCSWVSRFGDRFINTNRIAIVKVCTSNNPRQPPSWLKRYKREITLMQGTINHTDLSAQVITIRLSLDLISCMNQYGRMQRIIPILNLPGILAREDRKI